MSNGEQSLSDKCDPIVETEQSSRQPLQQSLRESRALTRHPQWPLRESRALAKHLQ